MFVHTFTNYNQVQGNNFQLSDYLFIYFDSVHHHLEVEMLCDVTYLSQSEKLMNKKHKTHTT